MLRRWVAFAVVLCAVVLVIPRSARADNSSAHSVAVAVLALDSDDAEEQADALTGALRSKIRNSQGWSLVETTQTLGMLTAALRCPGKPIPAECEQKIAEQLKTDRFIFGYVSKGPQAGQVTAEVHLFQKSKPDVTVRESFSDNLKDANDDTLRSRAQKILERLGGSAVGSIVVKMGAENGEVIIDGEKRVPMSNGTARVELSPGTHSVEASTKTGDTQKRNITVVAGKETIVDLALAGASTGPAEPAKEEKPFPVKKAIGGGVMAIGVAGLVVSVLFTTKWMSDKDDGEAANKRLHDNPNPQVPELPAGKEAGDVCGTGFFQNGSHPVCVAQEQAKTHSTIALTTGILGGVALLGGAYLFFFSGDSKPREPQVGKMGLQKVRVSPVFGITNGVSLSAAW
jgi:hypothetical protein